MFPEIDNVVLALIIVVASLILSWIAGLILNFAVHRFAMKTTTTLDDVFLQAVRGPVRAAIVIAGFQLGISQIEIIPDLWQERIDSFFFILYLLTVYVAVYRLISGLADWYGSEIIHRTDTDLDDKFISFFRALANIVATVIMIIILLGHFGIEPSALVATLGISTLAVALAAQETLSDVISGFMILIDQPFAIGDRVGIQDIDTWGDVTEVGLRSTRILTRDNRLVTVPNSVIGKGLIVNYSNPSTVYRVQTHISIAYGTDVDFAREVMIQALMAEEWVMKEKPVEALLLEFGDSSLIFRVRCWIEHFVETRRVIDQMNSALYKSFNKTDIVLAVPQRDIKLLPGSNISEDQPAT
jgi:small-conductance mechanosensitive channel